MADINQPFCAADQTLAFTVSMFALEGSNTDAERLMWAQIIEDVLPRVNARHPMMQSLIHASKELQKTIQPDGRCHLGYAVACYAARAAAFEFARWRCGRAYEVFKTERENGHG